MDNIFFPPSPARPPGPHHNASSIFTSAPGASRFAHEGLMPAIPRNLAPITQRGKTPTTHHWAPRGSTLSVHQTPTMQPGAVSTMQRGRSTASIQTTTTSVHRVGTSRSLGTANSTSGILLGKGDSSNGRKAVSAGGRGAEMRCGAVGVQLTALQQRERTIRELRAALRDAHAHLDKRNQQLQQLKRQLHQLQEERAREVSNHTEAELILSAARSELAQLGKTVHSLLMGPKPQLPPDISISQAAHWRAVHSSDFVQERHRQISPCCCRSCRCCSSSSSCHCCGCHHSCVAGSHDTNRGSADGESGDGGSTHGHFGYLCNGGVCEDERKCGGRRSSVSGRHISTAEEGFCHLGGKGRDLVLLCGDECRHLQSHAGGIRVLEEVDLSSASNPMGGTGGDGDWHVEEIRTHRNCRQRGEVSTNGTTNGALANVGSLLLMPVDMKGLLVAIMVGDSDEELERSHAVLNDLAEGQSGEMKPQSAINLIRRVSSPPCLSLIPKKSMQSDCSLKTMIKMIEGRAMEAPRASCEKWQNGKVTRRLIERALCFVWEACMSPPKPLQEERPIGCPSVMCGQMMSRTSLADIGICAKDNDHVEMDGDNSESVSGIERPSRKIDAYGDDRLIVERIASRNGKDTDAVVEVKQNDACDFEKDQVKDIKRNNATFEDKTTDFEIDSYFIEKHVKTIEEDSTTYGKQNTNLEKDTAGLKVVKSNCDIKHSKLKVEAIVDTELKKDSWAIEEDVTYISHVEDNPSDFEEVGCDFEKDVTSHKHDIENTEVIEVMDNAGAADGPTCDGKMSNYLKDQENYKVIAIWSIGNDKADASEKQAIIETDVNVQKGKVIEDTLEGDKDENLQREEGIEKETWNIQEDSRKNTEAVTNQINDHLDTPVEQVFTVLQRTPDVGQHATPDTQKEEEHDVDEAGCCVQAAVAGHLEPDPTRVVLIQQVADSLQAVELTFDEKTFGLDALTACSSPETFPAVPQRGSRSDNSNGRIVACTAVAVHEASAINEIVYRERETTSSICNEHAASSQSAHSPPVSSLVLASASSSESSAYWSDCSDEQCVSTTSFARPIVSGREASLSLYRRPVSEWSSWVALDWLVAGGPVLPGLVVWLACRAQRGDGAWRWIMGPYGGLAWPDQPLACGLMGLLRVCCVLAMSGLRRARREPDDSEKKEPQKESESKSRQ